MERRGGRRRRRQAERPPRLYGMTELVLDSYEALRACTRARDAQHPGHAAERLVVAVPLLRDPCARAILKRTPWRRASSSWIWRARSGSGTRTARAIARGHQRPRHQLQPDDALAVRSPADRGAPQGSQGRAPLRAFIGDLVPLLSASLVGDAATACFVCLSQAPDNLTQSKFALEFGETFAKLVTNPVRVKAVPRAKIEKAATALLREATRCSARRAGAASSRPCASRRSNDCERTLALMRRLE